MRLRFDLELLISLALIVGMGLLIHYSLSPQIINLHLMYLVIGSLLALFIIRLDFHYLPHFATHFYLLALFMLFFTLVLGTATRGSTRWLTLGTFQFQPSEFAKPLLIVALSQFIATTDITRFKNLVKISFLGLLPTVLVFFQPDLGSALVIGFIIASLIFAGGVRFRHLVPVALFLLVLSPLFFFTLKDYQKNRLLTFFDPTSDPLGKGYNSIQSIIAVGSGQITGRGLGHGIQSQLRFLPEYRTDFVFAALAEELGLLGSLLLLGGFSWLLWRLLRAADQTSSQFAYLVILGVTTMFATQIIIHIGMNIGLLPITGITLPLISLGGSSIVASFLSLGLAINASHLRRPTQPIEIN